MCGWLVSVDDVSQRHGTPSQTGPASTPEAIQDQQSSGGPLEKYQCSGGRALQIALNYCCQRERPWRRVPSSRACRAGHSASRTGPSLGDMWHVFAVQRKHDGRRTTTPSHGSFQGAENRHAPCWITQSRLGLQPVGQSHLRSESHQQGDSALRL